MSCINFPASFSLKPRRLDTADLVVREVLVGDKNVPFQLTAKHAVMGSALRIPLPSGLQSGASIVVKVCYNTTELGNALQWLEKEFVLVRDASRDSQLLLGRRRERRSLSYSVNASLFTPEHSHRYKVALVS